MKHCERDSQANRSKHTQIINELDHENNQTIPTGENQNLTKQWRFTCISLLSELDTNKRTITANHIAEIAILNNVKDYPLFDFN